MFGEKGLGEEEIRAVVQRSWEECSEVFNEEDAVDWSRGEDGEPFQFPASAGVADGKELDAYKGDLAALVRRRQQQLAAVRMSRERIARVVDQHDPDQAGLLDIVDGMGIFVCEEGPNAFKPSAQPPPLRNKYKRVAPAVNKMIWDLHEQGHVLLLPTEKAKKIKQRNQLHRSSLIGQRNSRNAKEDRLLTPRGGKVWRVQRQLTHWKRSYL
jgi:hypothetical protein